MRKLCIIRQPAGLGDILCCQKIAESVISRYTCDVIWPVISEYEFISRYIQTNNLTFINETIDFPYKDIYQSGPITPIIDDSIIYIPLQSADQVYPHDLIHKSKYKLVGLDIAGWDKSLKFVRDRVREDILYYDILKLQDDEKYTLVNTLYGSPPHSKHIDNITPSGKSKTVQLQYITGFNPFDWCKVIELADEIHMVDTCFSFIIEKLTCIANSINFYSRNRLPDSPSFEQTRWLFSEKFNWVHN